MPVPLRVTVDDYHTAGEPFRIVTGGVDALAGATVLDKRSFACDYLDDVRALLVNEPRGHADMYGCFVTEPDDAGGDLGVVFFHKDGFSTACGHGTIALATWAVRTGRISAVEPTTSLVIDAPSGRLAVDVDVCAGVVDEVRFTNVASWVAELDVPAIVTLAGRQVPLTVDVSYGGAFYASLPASAVNAQVRAVDIPVLIDVARQITTCLAEHPCSEHPDDPRLSGLYGVIFYEDVPRKLGAALAQRNVTVFADGEVDRSPCGSGTSARLTVLYQRGASAPGDVLYHEGIVGGVFTGRILDVLAGVGPRGTPAVVTQISGRAYPTGSATFILDPDDPLGLGFQLR